MKTFLLSISLGFLASAYAQDTMIVYFVDKGAQPELLEFSEKSIDRRDRNQVFFDSKDFKVHQEYLDQLQEYGRVLHVSRWLNAVSFVTTHNLQSIQGLSFVNKAHLARGGSQPLNKDYNAVITEKSVDYGIADTQVVIMNLDCMHDMGFTGEGVLIAVIDAGFRGMDTISYFDNLYGENRIVDMYNFVGSGNVYQYSGHGTAVSSCIVGEKTAPNTFGGTAIDATLALFVAEDVASETPIEELNVVVALERADSIGADVANISLGYKTFDDPTDDHPYSDMDGVTTIAAQGVNVAASKGIVVAVSAGNDGPNTISTPCDADSALCVGAVNKSGIYTFFSSVGPAFDGDIKPNVAAVGRKAWAIMEDGQLSMVNGTSFSSPITAGGVACVLSALPNTTVDQMMTAIQSTASQASNPDSLLGYGIPDFCAAYYTLPGASMPEFSNQTIEMYPVPATDRLFIKGIKTQHSSLNLEIVNTSGKVIKRFVLDANQEIEINISNLDAGTYIAHLFNNDVDLQRKLIVIPN